MTTATWFSPLMMRMAISVIAVFCFALYAAYADTSDLAREKRLAEEIIDNIFDGEPIFLEADGTIFFAIFTQSEIAEPRGAAIILHGRSFHPDWPEVVAPLRTALPRHGWHTLSLQMPVLHKQAKYYDYVPIFPEAFPRIKAGIQFLRTRGIDTLVLIAHSCGVHMNTAFVDRYGDRDVDAYVSIGMGATNYKQPMKKPFPLDKMAVPVLDVYGSKDTPLCYAWRHSALTPLRQQATRTRPKSSSTARGTTLKTRARQLS